MFKKTAFNIAKILSAVVTPFYVVSCIFFLLKWTHHLVSSLGSNYQQASKLAIYVQEVGIDPIDDFYITDAYNNP